MNNITLCKLLITLGFLVPIQVYATQQEEQLIQAVKTNNVEQIIQLLQAGASINCVDEQQYTPLMYAIRVPNNSRLLRLLLHYGADIYYKTPTGENALYVVLREAIFVYNLINHLNYNTDKVVCEYWKTIVILILYGAPFNASPNSISSTLSSTLKEFIAPLSLALLLHNEKKIETLLRPSPPVPFFKKLAYIVHRVTQRSQPSHEHEKERLYTPPADAYILIEARLA